ncbi:MAG: HTH domain-containing protein, partial [Anaerolineae bacterium]|nr:HTH domain-containing protein [Anaerolineae bacterium]
MRADRLLAILMLLQARGRMTARALANELEVSERTIYRDVDALSMAGVPVYTERGPGGGCALLDEYRTTLTGLNAAEIRALFLLTIPAQLDELGFSGELKAALRKLAAALPDPQRAHETRVRQRLHLDSAPWSHSAEPTPFLHRLHQAVWEDRCVRLTYRIFTGQRLTREVAPYGLVAKNGVWHLVCGADDGPLNVVLVSRIAAAEVLAESFSRPS